MQTLLSNISLQEAIATGSRSAGTTDVNGTAVDMKGYEGLVALIEFGTITASAVTSVKMQESDSSTTGWTDIDDAEIDVAADDDNDYFAVDCANIRKRYARVVVDRGTANAALRAALYIKYNPSFAPTTHQSGRFTTLVTTPA